jgi:DNA-binding transcriptional regulator YiaG
MPITKMKRTRPRTTPLGQRIIKSLRQAVESAERGESPEVRFTVRTVELPPAPHPYDAAGVRATRHRLGASQSVFASLLGVSAALVRSLEQGQRTAAPVLRRLLDEINHNPKRWQAMIRGSTAA